MGRLSDAFDAGQELLAVVVLAQLRRHLTHERVLRGVELRPACGDGRESSEAAAADARLILDLCLGDRAPSGLVDFFASAQTSPPPRQGAARNGAEGPALERRAVHDHPST